MSFYDDMALMAKDMTTRYKTGQITLRRTTSPKAEPDAPYNPASVVTYDQYELNAVVLGVTAKYVDGEMVKYDDLHIITSPFFIFNGQEVLIEPQMSDEIWIDGVNHRVNKIERIPAAGTVSAFYIFVSA